MSNNSCLLYINETLFFNYVNKYINFIDLYIIDIFGFPNFNLVYSMAAIFDILMFVNR